MNNSSVFKQQYEEATLLSSKALAEGNKKIANKQAQILQEIFDNIEAGRIESSILVELLEHPHIDVRALAAIDLLRLKTETNKAEETLEKIVSLDQTKMDSEVKFTVFKSSIQLKSWKEKGFVN
jgi:hypothetical protein